MINIVFPSFNHLTAAEAMLKEKDFYHSLSQDKSLAISLDTDDPKNIVLTVSSPAIAAVPLLPPICLYFIIPATKVNSMKIKVSLNR